MLRNSLRSVRGPQVVARPAALGRQWVVGGRPAPLGQRSFADDKKPTVDYPKPSTSQADAATQTKEAAAAAAAPLPPPKKGLFRRLRTLILALTILGGAAFGGGVMYSRVNDNFHDFFTEYVPFGERAVSYFEEQDFRKRFPTSWNRTAKPIETGGQVKVPASSGASWRVAEGKDPVGRRHSAVDKTKAAKTKAAEGKAEEAVKSTAASTKDVAEKVETKAKEGAAKAAEKPASIVPDKPPVEKKMDSTSNFKPPEVNEPSKFPPIPLIDALKIKDADEPIVQDLVRMLNDVIAVINADNAHARYGNTIEKAKGDVARVGAKIREVKAQAEEQAAAEVRKQVDEFDKASTMLLDRVTAVMANQERNWRHEFEEEMAKVRQSYDDKVKLLLGREKKLHEERLANKMLEQAVTLKRDFVGSVRSHVEQEREGRLGKLDELSAAVSDLEKLTGSWNDVVDKNLQTQQLHVAVEAVRASLEDARHPRPFVKELVALKQIAKGDAVVDAAISSINPSAYQRGVSTPAQLMDRFRRVASEVRKASLLPDDAGVASHASSWALSKVMFRRDGLAAGDDVESILTRTQTYLEEGNLDAAAREMNGLSGWAKTLSKDWLGEVRKVLEVQQALDVISTEARLQSLRVG